MVDIVSGDNFKNMLTSTNRQVLNSFRKKLQERSADTDYSNQELYLTLFDHAKWLIKREVRSGNVYKNNSFFQTLGCQEIIETSTIDPCCPIKVNCKIYRTKNKLPETWIDDNGPILRAITSVDGSTEFYMTTPGTWLSIKKDPYKKWSKAKYAFAADGYLWFPEHNPHYIDIVGYFIEDVEPFDGCKEKKDCTRWLDTKFPLPDWLHAEMMSKALEQLIPSKQMQADVQIDKNTNRRN